MLKKKIFIKGKIKTLTGLHIGAARESAEIGGMDNPIIKDPITGLPYIPGSSLKGKMRSLLEKSLGKNFNRVMHLRPEVKIHVCDDKNSAKNCEVCRLFGSSGKENHPARAYFRDAYLTKEWKEKMRSEDLIEVKYETAIDRITSAANPRPMERVPAGVEFDFEIVYNVEDDNWKEDLKNLLKAMRLLEDDYLGGSGSRGYGKVKFTIESILERDVNCYLKEEEEKLISKEITIEDAIKMIDEKMG
jgi:CRISPR-associated protein Csm3